MNQTWIETSGLSAPSKPCSNLLGGTGKTKLFFKLNMFPSSEV